MDSGPVSAWKLLALIVVPAAEAAFIAMHCHVAVTLYGLSLRAAGLDVMAPASSGDVITADVSNDVVKSDSDTRERFWSPEVVVRFLKDSKSRWAAS
jgi:hypothetical protein